MKTRLMVLGFLLYKSMSGYEMQQHLQQSQTDTWAGVLPGSIYHALKKMEKEQLVAIESVEQTGNRSKAIYQITEKGKEEFKHLLISGLTESSASLPTTFYTALSFIPYASNDLIIEALNKQETLLQQEYEQMKIGKKIKEEAIEVPEHTLLLFENMFLHYEIQLSFVKKLKESLTTKNK
ncbi:PadR family transcriptional regulator [Alkalihalobacterium bogoriense]|uniref:PadR family transcriptional regulator n=1 Tax=Alkalihalobacterium bogoriense TaxID=246272 RepID=UPI00054D8CF6|nr:PadR family transcriptional regulator [Alkalihalobacterium bogoriense]